MPFPPTFTNVWNITQPPDTELANLLGQNLRDLKNDIMQRISLLGGTLANRPTPEVANATWGGAGYGLLYFATDTNQVFQWNGAAWIDVTSGVGGGGNKGLINAQGASGAITGNGAAQVFFTFSLPANTVASGHILRIKIYWNRNSVAGNATLYNVTLNGVAIAPLTNSATPGSQFYAMELIVLNTGPASAQVGHTVFFAGNSGNGVVNVNTPNVAAGLNWAGAQTLQITFSCPNPDTVTPELFTVEVF